MKPPKFYRKFNYDKSLLPNKYLASMEQGVSTVEEAKAKTGLSIGYPGWCLIYYALLSHLNPEGNNLIVETGTNQGWTTIILAQALRDSNGRGKIYTVELDHENYKIALANFQQAGVADLIKAINGDSKIELKKIVNKYDSVKVAFLDASHLFDDVIAEFEIILPALDPQSLVVFDNTYSIAEEHEDQRVNGALKEILKRHGGNLVNFEFVSWYTPGVAIWQKSPFDSLKTIEANNKSKHTNNITPQSDSKKSQKDMMSHSQEELKLWEILQKLFSMVEYSDFKRALECIALIDKQIIGRHCGDLGDKVAQYLAIIQFFRKSGVEGADSIEIGTLFGGSCLIKLMAMRDLNVGGKIICIDPMEGYYGNKVDPYSGLEVKTDILFNNLDIFGFSKEAIELKRMPSNENQATAGLVEGAYATLMIDGDHSYQGVRSDWDQYNNFVSKGGFILLDDYAEPAWPDITKFVKELIGILPPDWDVIGQIGTTFLLKKNTNSIEVDLLANYRRTSLPEEILSDSKALLARYKDKHRDQRCVIIGNGPSLNKMDLSFLKDEITFGMNRIYLMFDKYSFRPTYYVSVNPLVIEQSVEDILKIQAPKFLALNALPYVQDPRGIAFLKSIGRPSFSKDITNGLWEGYTVTYVAMQLAYFMGFSEVILIGVDHHFTTSGQPNQEVISGGNDPNHFHPDYFGKGTRWNLPDLKNSEIAYRLAKQAFDADGRRIIDATADGKLTIFPKEDYKDLFKRYRKIDLEGKGQLAEISFLNKQGEDKFNKGK
ncbi:MAG: CmcI family methyltransferase [Thermodesulfobacteriota bacterium]|nr:CmcI family methyltransferase [Thermodesulfobacteriota bacterium]